MNPLTTSVQVELDKPRHLSFPFNAFVAFEEATGQDLLAVFDGMAKGNRPTMKVLRAMVWSGLLQEEPTLTPEQVGEFMSLRNFAELAPLLAEALMLALPEVKKDDSENPRKAPPKRAMQPHSIGATSGQ